MYFNRWTTFSASALLQVACSGLTYTFAVLAPVFKDACGMTEAQVAALGSLGFNLGGCFAIVAGLAFNMLGRKNHLAPRVVIWVGVVLLGTGYLGIYGCAVGIIMPSFPLLLTFSFLAGHSGIWFDTAVMVTNVRNFPDDRGTIVGILKAFLGLSGTLYAAIYSGTFQPNAIDFVLFVGIVTPFLSFFLSIFINLVPEEYHDPTMLPVSFVSHVASDNILDHGPHPPGPRELAPDPTHGGVHHEHPTELDIHPVGERGPVHSSGHLAVDAIDHAGESGRAHVHGEDRAVALSVNGTSPTEMVEIKPGVSKATRFLLVYILVAVMSMYGMVSAIWTSEYHPSSSMRQAFTLVLLGLLSAMLFVPASVGPCIYPKRNRHKKRHFEATGVQAVEVAVPQVDGATEDGLPEDRRPLLQKENSWQLGPSDLLDPPKLAKDFYRQGTFRNLDSGEDGEDTLPPVEMNLMMAVRTLPFWLVFYSFAVGVGTGLMYMNNLAAYVVSLGGHEGDQVVFVALFSVANAAGRLLLGYVSEYFLHARGMPRTLFFSGVSCIMMLLSLGAIWATTPDDLFPITLIAGVGFGGHWSVIPAIVSDIFGLTSFASNYTFIQFAPAIGGFMLATVLTSYEYSAASIAHGGDGTSCIGVDCFYNTWVVVLFLNMLSVLSTVWLTRCCKDIYKRMDKENNKH